MSLFLEVFAFPFTFSLPFPFVLICARLYYAIGLLLLHSGSIVTIWLHWAVAAVAAAFFMPGVALQTCIVHISVGVLSACSCLFRFRVGLRLRQLCSALRII